MDFNPDGMEPNNRYKFLGRSGKMNWKEIQELNLELVVKWGDIEELQKILSNITFSELNERDINLQPHEYILKMVKALQLSVEYLVHTQKKLIAINNNLTKSNQAYRQKVKYYKEKLKLKLQNQRGQKKKSPKKEGNQSPNNKSVHEAYQCNLCSKVFENEDFLGKHMDRRHGKEDKTKKIQEFEVNNFNDQRIESGLNDNHPLSQADLETSFIVQDGDEQSQLIDDLYQENKRLKADLNLKKRKNGRLLDSKGSKEDGEMRNVDSDFNSDISDNYLDSGSFIEGNDIENDSLNNSRKSKSNQIRKSKTPSNSRNQYDSPSNKQVDKNYLNDKDNKGHNMSTKKPRRVRQNSNEGDQQDLILNFRVEQEQQQDRIKKLQQDNLNLEQEKEMQMLQEKIEKKRAELSKTWKQMQTEERTKNIDQDDILEDFNEQEAKELTSEDDNVDTQVYEDS
ncbi:MAG: hypothetical protein EZS28_019165 [Streblomastix strix]|uniref:C2H2-type domain-containing protein n=1 Tax=Streblomastix strix TaxID=222440 RepID=A0A5J4VSX4_9EUKA|nr:MAG: hypothetical protein EZS28_019165 [Streblomastix strix]